MLLLAAAALAGLMAEIRHRRERFLQICVVHHEQTEACFDRAGRICKDGETSQSIEAFYRRRGPAVWSDYKMALYHLHLADKYEQAARRPWLPVLPDLPPPGGFSNLRALAAWGLETGSAAAPLIGVAFLILTWRAMERKGAV
jgi:hypothetical protein